LLINPNKGWRAVSRGGLFVFPAVLLMEEPSNYLTAIVKPIYPQAIWLTHKAVGEFARCLGVGTA
jgi:hypothetical protein